MLLSIYQIESSSRGKFGLLGFSAWQYKSLSEHVFVKRGASLCAEQKGEQPPLLFLHSLHLDIHKALCYDLLKKKAENKMCTNV